MRSYEELGLFNAALTLIGGGVLLWDGRPKLAIIVTAWLILPFEAAAVVWVLVSIWALFEKFGAYRLIIALGCSILMGIAVYDRHSGGVAQSEGSAAESIASP